MPCQYYRIMKARAGSSIRVSSNKGRIAVLEAELVKVKEERDLVKAERDLLRSSYERLRLELDLLKKRIFVAKAERVDTVQLELEFAQKLAEIDQLSGLLEDD